MLASLTDDFKIGVRIKGIIDEKKIVKHSEAISNAFGYHEVIFMYSNDISKKEHEEEMKKDGWSIIDGQSYIHIYCNLWEDKRISVPCGIYEKEIECCFK